MSQLKLGQVQYQGQKRILVIKDGQALIKMDSAGPADSLAIVASCSAEMNLHQAIEQALEQYEFKHLCSLGELLAGESEAALLKPINPPEVWAVGVTYKRQAREHDIDLEKRTGSTEELYYRVYANERAEVFFKGFDRSSRGPNEAITLRADCKQIMPEAEMVMVLGHDGLPVGFTAGNDLTAWDLELECPLYLNQAKIWDGSAGVGPFVVPVDDFGNPYERAVGIEVIRNDEVILESSGSTSELKRSLEELCYWLNYNNPVPSGTLLFTGTGCVIPHDFALQHDDVVNVTVDNVGILSNSIVALKPLELEYQTR